MGDDVSGVGLWDDEGALDDDDLPISTELGARLRCWVDDYTATIGGANDWWGQAEHRDHDRRGHALSVDVQRELGSGYGVRYVFNTTEVRRELAP